MILYGIKLLGCFPWGYFVLLGFRLRFELLKQVISPCPKCTDYCGMNMSNMTLKPEHGATPSTKLSGNVKEVFIFYDQQKVHHISGQSEIYRVTVLLQHAVCETSCPPQQQEQGLRAAVPGLATTDAKLHCCCCWCCSPVLLWFGHTHAHKNCASDLWVEGIQTTSRDTPAGCAASRP